jgi:hypothetical protein
MLAPMTSMRTTAEEVLLTQGKRLASAEVIGCAIVVLEGRFPFSHSLAAELREAVEGDGLYILVSVVQRERSTCLE